MFERVLNPIRFLRGTQQPVAPVRDAAGPTPAPQRPADGETRNVTLRRQRLAEAFTPTRPQLGHRTRPAGGQEKNCFVGRDAEFRQILRALTEDHSHVILYGERGYGKTSLANLAAGALRSAGLPVARHVCAVGSDFDAIMRGLFRSLPLRSLDLAVPGAGEGMQNAEALLPARPVQPADVAAVAARFREVRPVLVIDEFDRIADDATRVALADTIKQLSDQNAGLFFLIIGVSDDLEQLLGRHPSIQRCITAIAMPVLRPIELEEIISRGGREAGIEYPAAARTSIAILARGIPYVAHLLALRAGQAALERGEEIVSGASLVRAILDAQHETDPRIISLYDMLTRNGQDAGMVALLRSAAGNYDAFGRFALHPAPGGIHLGRLRDGARNWQRLQQSGAVAAAGGRPDFFAFTEAMLPVYVMLRAIGSRHS